MKFINLFTITIGMSVITEGQSEQKLVTISFNKNVELMGYIIHLGDPDDIDPEHPISKELNRYPEDKSNPILLEIIAKTG